MTILFLGSDELTRDPRVRRAIRHAQTTGAKAVGVCLAAGAPLPLEGVSIRRYGSRLTTRTFPQRVTAAPTTLRELRGVLRLVRWAARTVGLIRAAHSFTDVDVVHANDLETLPAAAFIAGRRKARLVYDSHEIALDQDPSTPRVFRIVARPLERWLARRADAVVTVSTPIATVLASDLGLRQRPLVVLNAPERTADIDVRRDSARLEVIYQGATGPGRRLDDLIEAAAAMTSSARLSIRVAGVDLDDLRAQVQHRGLGDRVAVLDPVEPHEMVEALAAFDVGLIINRAVSRNDELVFPNKLFEYLMAGLAVVAPALPGLESLLTSERVGEVFTPGDPLDLAAVIDRLASDRPAVVGMQQRARRAALDRYNAEAQGPTLAAAWGVA